MVIKEQDTTDRLSTLMNKIQHYASKIVDDIKKASDIFKDSRISWGAITVPDIYDENARKRKSMGFGSKINLNNNPSYPIGVGNYSNKNKMINFDKKAANKGALPVIMKKENQKIINNKQEKNDKKEIDFDNKTNNNDISGVNMIDEALKNFKNMNDDSSFMDVSNISKWMK